MKNCKLTFLFIIILMINIFFSGCDKTTISSFVNKEEIIVDEILLFEIEDTYTSTGDLYLIDGLDERTKIDSKVINESFQITPRDKKILYVTDDNTLYLKELGKEKEKISSDVYPYTIRISGDETTVIFEKEGTENSYDLYINKIGQDKEKICSDSYSFDISYSGDKVYYINMENDLYLKEINKEKEKLASNVDFVKQFENGKVALYETNDYNFYYKNTNEDDKIKLSSDSVELYTNLYVRNNGEMVTYLKEFDYTKYRGELYLYEAGDEPHKVASDVIYHHLSDNGKYIHYINDEEELFLLDIKRNKKVKIASEVENVLFSSDGTSLVYLDKDDNLYYKTYKKDKEKISTDVYSWSFVDNKILILNNDKELFEKQLKKEKIKIASDIVDFMISDRGTCLFYYNEDNELFSKINDNIPNIIVDSIDKNTEIYIQNYKFLTKELTFADISGIWKNDYFNEVIVISEDGNISISSCEEEYYDILLNENNSSSNYISASMDNLSYDFSLVDENTLSIDYNDYYRITDQEYIDWKENKVLDNFLYGSIYIISDYVPCYDNYQVNAEYLGSLEYGNEIYVDDVYKDVNDNIWIKGTFFDDDYYENEYWFIYDDELMYLE